MKTLLLMRHGKAEREHEGSDKSRELTDRGVRQSREIGALIARHFGFVDLVVASDAVRAAQTARLAAEAASYTGQILFLPQVYEASTRTLIALIRAFPEKDSTVLLVGHNPGIEGLASDLAGTPLAHVPTAGLVVLTLPDPWSDADVGLATRAAIYEPQ